MNGKYLLDTNIIISFLNNVPAITNFIHSIEDDILTSVICKIELLSYHAMDNETEKLISQFLSGISIIPLNFNIETTAILFRRQTHCKLPDAIVAASAIAMQSILVTNDKRLAALHYPGYVTYVPNYNLTL